MACAVTMDPAAIGPHPTNYRAAVKRYIEKTFFDPYSLRSVRLSIPREGHIFFQQGWIVCLEANAKNRFGAYTGLRRTALLIRNDEVIGSSSGERLCDDPTLAFSRWEELGSGK